MADVLQMAFWILLSLSILFQVLLKFISEEFSNWLNFIVYWDRDLSLNR